MIQLNTPLTIDSATAKIIASHFSGDILPQGQIREPFLLDDKMFVTTAFDNAKGQWTCYCITLPSAFNDDSFFAAALIERPDLNKAARKGTLHGAIVKMPKQSDDFILQGPPLLISIGDTIESIPKYPEEPPTQQSIAEDRAAQVGVSIQTPPEPDPEPPSAADSSPVTPSEPPPASEQAPKPEIAPPASNTDGSTPMQTTSETPKKRKRGRPKGTTKPKAGQTPPEPQSNGPTISPATEAKTTTQAWAEGLRPTTNPTPTKSTLNPRLEYLNLQLKLSTLTTNRDFVQQTLKDPRFNDAITSFAAAENGLIEKLLTAPKAEHDVRCEEIKSRRDFIRALTHLDLVDEIRALTTTLTNFEEAHELFLHDLLPAFTGRTPPLAEIEHYIAQEQSNT